MDFFDFQFNIKILFSSYIIREVAIAATCLLVKQLLFGLVPAASCYE